MTEISKEYATALFELSVEENREEEYLSALKKANHLLQLFPEYTILLSSPDIPMNSRKAMLKSAFGECMPSQVLFFLLILCEKRRIELFSECLREFESLLKALKKVSSARIISAVELSDAEKSELLKKLEKISGNKVNPIFEKDPSLLGGAVVYIDDKFIDGSLRRKLKSLKEEIGG